MYITVFYVISAITLAGLLGAVWVAVVLKGSDTVNPWLRRWAYCAGWAPCTRQGMSHVGFAACMHPRFLPCRPMLCCAVCCCRLIGLLQLMALVIFCIAWPTLLDYTVFMFDCKWSNIEAGLPAVHVYFTEQSKCHAID